MRKELVPVLDLMAGATPLIDTTEATTLLLLRAVGWPGQIYRSSDLPSRQGRSERLADLTRAVGATTYLCGTGGRRYLDTTPFTTGDLNVNWFQPPTHPDDTPAAVWSLSRKISAIWALMTFCPDTVRRDLLTTRRQHR